MPIYVHNDSHGGRLILPYTRLYHVRTLVDVRIAQLDTGVHGMVR